MPAGVYRIIIPIVAGFGLLTGACTSPETEKVEFFVSPEGDQTGDGSRESPFHNLERARDAVRRVENGKGKEIRVWLRGGVHRITGTVVFGMEDSAKPGSRIVYAAYPGEKAVLSGSSPLPGEWKESKKDKVWEIPLPEGWPEVRALYSEGALLPRARSKGVVPLKKPPAEVPYRQRRAIDQKHLYLPLSFVSEIRDFRGAEIALIPKFPWVWNQLTVESVDRSTGLLRTVEAATYPMVPPPMAYFNKGTIWVENVLSVLDEPGEWVYDRKERKLYLWPPDGSKPDERIEVGRVTELLRIAGEVVETDLEDRPVTGLHFHGLHFTRANGFAWDTDKVGKGLQHDWEMHDRATAMVRLRGAEDCIFTQCTFEESAAAGLRMDLHCRRNEVRRCTFSKLGGVGVLMAGYGMGMKDVNRDNVVADSDFQYMGRQWRHSPAVFLWQSGHNRIVHNRIRHTPYTAIVVSGRTQLDRAGDKESSRTVRWDELNLLLEGEERTWQNREPLMHGRFNTIAFNDISHCMEELGDGNAIYISGTGRGNRVNHNFIHDITSPNINAAIRCDDDQHEVIVENNIIARCCGEGFVNKGRNDFLNNIIYDLRSKSPQGRRSIHQRGYLVFSGAPVSGSRVMRNLFVSKETQQKILFDQKRAGKQTGGQRSPGHDAYQADKNLYFNTSNRQWAEEFLRQQQSRGLEINSMAEDPDFAGPDKNDFKVRSREVLEKLAFEQIDSQEAGMRKIKAQD